MRFYEKKGGSVYKGQKKLLTKNIGFGYFEKQMILVQPVERLVITKKIKNEEFYCINLK